MATSLGFAPGHRASVPRAHQRGRVRSARDCEQKHWKCREAGPPIKQPWRLSASRNRVIRRGRTHRHRYRPRMRANPVITIRCIGTSGPIPTFASRFGGLSANSATGALQFRSAACFTLAVALGYCGRSRQASRRPASFPSARRAIDLAATANPAPWPRLCLVDTLRKDSAASR